MATKELGKIGHVRFGHGGYQEAMIGLSLSFDLADGGGVSTFIGFWNSPPSESTKWTEDDRITAYGKTMVKLSDLLREAKVHDVYELLGKPVEVEMEGQCFKSFRILTEVL